MANPSRNWFVLAPLGLIWLQFFAALAPSWAGGDYYSYGWYVAPAAVWFFARRWQPGDPPGGHPPASIEIPALVLWLASLLLVRVLSHVDPLWRLPLWGHAALVVAATHYWLATRAGAKAARAQWPVILFALCAVPYPSFIENALVQNLTGAVIAVTVEAFNLAGRPVVAQGDLLRLGETVVEVSEGCSGIRSFQSFLMAALFFGELYRFSVPRRVLLFLLAVVLAVAVNAGRAMTLAHIGFTHGNQAADAAHDTVGLAAFAISAALFYLASSALDRYPRKARARRASA